MALKGMLPSALSLIDLDHVSDLLVTAFVVEQSPSDASEEWHTRTVASHQTYLDSSSSCLHSYLILLGLCYVENFPTLLSSRLRCNQGCRCQ